MVTFAALLVLKSCFGFFLWIGCGSPNSACGLLAAGGTTFGEALIGSNTIGFCCTDFVLLDGPALTLALLFEMPANATLRHGPQNEDPRTGVLQDRQEDIAGFGCFIVGRGNIVVVSVEPLFQLYTSVDAFARGPDQSDGSLPMFYRP